MEPLLQSLYLECRSLELVTEAMGTLHTQAQGDPCDFHDQKGLRPREHQRVRELHAWLSSGQADAMSMDDIARQAGVNANTLQRQFRAVYGTTIFDHLRESRLLRARQALELQGVTVGQAAMIAGYNSAANFSTAYRRRFGTPPKLVRTRV
ncbi:Regulatory protein soxS [Comamonas aquatica]|uniref:Regulatory protein soxS n=2 Tax=Comamonas aquatica TaxID=225991 RepID=A0AA35D8E0_9BURK|nr:Regulatory protein soxS [Comamonas aquatica]CAB5696493.1 Regulatory protein soxS [Comamonas aquatica]CAC9216605.1 Regulatory protein soxS [Comamonas aquatica]CAC9684980.1 Regulatory protein soxS [Comamonas aquatica]